MTPILRGDRAWFVCAAALIFSAAAAAQAASAAAPSVSAVLYENVRVFDGKADTLSAASNVLVVGNLINKISTTPIVVDPT